MLNNTINKGTLIKLFKEGFIVSFTEYFSLGILFLVIVLINIYYGNVAMADFNLCYGVAQIAIIGAGGAFSAIIRRDVSLDNKPGKSYINNVLQLRLGLIVVCLILALIVLLFNTNSTGSFLYFLPLILLAKGLDILSETYYTTYQSLNEYRRYAILKMLNALLFIAGVATVAACRLPVHFIYLSMVASSLMSVAVNFFAYRGYVIKKEWAEKNASQQDYKMYLLAESWPIMLNAVFFQLSSRINIYIILILAGKDAVALFSGCLMAVTVFTAVSNSIGVVLFPGLNREFNRSTPLAFFKKTTTALFVLFMIGCATAVVFYFTIPFQLTVIGKLPAGADELFKYATFSIPFSFSLAAVAYSFVIIKKQQFGLYLSVITLLFNILVFYLCINASKLHGMAYAYILSCVFQVLIMYLSLYSLLKKTKSVIN